MRKILYGIAALVLSSTAFTSVSEGATSSFRSGVHYDIISDTATETPEVKEFFSFYCGACFQYEPFAQMMKEEFGDSFSKYHVSFLSPRGMDKVVVQAWSTALVLGVQDEVSSLLFRKHFQQRNMTRSKEEMTTVFLGAGVDKQDFERAYDSFAVRSLTNRQIRQSEEYNVSGTPTFIINGKYRMNPQGFRDSPDFFGEYLELARYLYEKSN